MKRLGSFLPVLLFSYLTSGLSHAASITDLGILPGYTSSGAAAVSADGKIVVGSSSKYVNEQNIVEPFIWTAAQGMIGLGWMPGCTNCSAAEVSTNGVVVGNCRFTNRVVAFKWTAQSGFVPLANPGQPETYGFSISANGQVIVGAAGQLNSFRAAKWSAANEFTELTSLLSEARGVSGDGSVIVGHINETPSDSKTSLAVRWRAGEPVEYLNTIANPPDGFKLYTANAVSLDGQFIAGYCKTPLYEEAYIWSAATGVKNLGSPNRAPYKPTGKIAALPGFPYTEAFAVSEDGNAAVGRNIGTIGVSRTFIWTEEDGPRDIAQVLNDAAIFDPLWDATATFSNYTDDLSADGTIIVGSMVRASIGNRPFLLDLRDIKVLQTGSNLQLTWPEGFKLQQSNGLDLNSWQDASGATSPFPISSVGEGHLYRIVPLP